MAGDVKTRPYDNSRRQARVRATRQEVLTAARDLFLERGYPPTTVEAIAEASDTPVATVYRLFGSKRAILSAVLDVAFGGDDEPIAFGERPAVRDAFAQADANALIDGFARIGRELQERAAAIQHVLAGAAAVDAEAAEQLVITRQQRLTGQSRVAAELARRNALASGLTEAEAADLIYVFMSPEVYRILNAERGWSPKRYEVWLATTLRRALLPNQG
jgi:TetR/AcrR family transcriptional regulator, regulator of autoinduction and epiphytic fitness